MRQLITKPFPYYVGVYSLEEFATKKIRVCVLNILGNESRKVTPVSHEYSGGNVVAGVQYGRRGTLETKIGNIPVYRSVLEVMNNGHSFDVGVIYLPPQAVSQAVWELVRYNKELKRIIIVTEKISTRDSMNIRFICQEAGVDVIGANSLGVLNAWDHVRVGGALGGDNPEETMQKGSIAIHSNSGNFTTTIAEYLRTAGFGISTAMSSGKDIYIHFAAPEFLYAAQNDPRTKAIVLYVEPGAYYEKMALDWIQERRFGFNKPIVVCVTGRWKKEITRPCGHAGAIAGSGDDAESKEKWFDEYFGVGVFDPKHPKTSKRGVRVASIHHIPEAMRHVFQKMDEKPDFKSSGDLSLKLWISDNFVKPSPELDLPVVAAIPPYDKQITEINKQIGAHYLRQNMRNKSSASRIDSKTEVAELHGKSVLELSKYPYEENLYFALAKLPPKKSDTKLTNVLLNCFLKVDQTQMDAMNLGKANSCTPNAYLASQIALIGDNPLLEKVRECVRWIINLIRELEIHDQTIAFTHTMDDEISKKFLSKKSTEENSPFEFLLKEIDPGSIQHPSFQVVQRVLLLAEKQKLFVQNKAELFIAAIAVYALWNPMLEKRISRQVVEDAVSYLYIISQMIAFSVIQPDRNLFWQKSTSDKNLSLHTSFTENIFKILFNRKPTELELIELKYLLGLTITNGPGTLSAKGAKESVSARNDISTAFVGFLSNTGLAHGGNGFEAVEYLLEQFEKSKLVDPGQKDKNIHLQKLANEAAKSYARYKLAQKEAGQTEYKRIPCINHPVFKGNAVNIDPREDFIRKELEDKGIYNVFLDFYHQLVKELFNEGVTENVFCVNVDAVLAVITLKLVWKDFVEKKMTKKQVQNLVFTLFILGRSIGTTAEIADHRIRGEDMDCRTPQSELAFVL